MESGNSKTNIGDHPFSKYLNISEKLAQINPCQINSFMTEPLSYRNLSTDLQSKSMDWFLYDNGLRHERVKKWFGGAMIWPEENQNNIERIIHLAGTENRPKD